MYVYKLAECCGLLAINDTINLGGSINLTFIAVTNESRTYHKALYSFYLSKWKHTIETKYTQLLKAGVFE